MMLPKNIKIDFKAKTFLYNTISSQILTVFPLIRAPGTYQTLKLRCGAN